MFTFCNKISSPGDYECSPLAQRASPAQSPVTLQYGECHPPSHRPAPAHTSPLTWLQHCCGCPLTRSAGDIGQCEGWVRRPDGTQWGQGRTGWPHWTDQDRHGATVLHFLPQSDFLLTLSELWRFIYICVTYILILPPYQLFPPLNIYVNNYPIFPTFIVYIFIYLANGNKFLPS